MNWIKAIGEEIGLAARLTVEPLKEGKRSDPGWLRDKHLRNGFFLGLVVFIPGTAIVMSFVRHVAVFAVLLPVSLLANLVWLGYAARSRRRDGNVESPRGTNAP